MAGAERDTTIIGDDDAGERLDRWLAAPERLGSRKRAAEALERGKIFLDDEEQGVRDGGRLLAAGARVRIWLDRPGSARGSQRGSDLRARAERSGGRSRGGALSILHEDEDCIVVDKPAGLLTVARAGGRDRDDTVIARLETLIDPARRRRLHVVHRIDRGTSGVVLVARHRAAADALIAQFRARTPLRRYLAVAEGAPAADTEEWVDLLVTGKDRMVRPARSGEGGEEARSRVRVVERFPGGPSLLEVTLVTGKRNQIRVQSAMRGFPLVGETLYRDLGRRGEEPDGAPEVGGLPRGRIALHAETLGFVSPTSGATIEVTAPRPSDLVRLIEALRGDRTERGKR